MKKQTKVLVAATLLTLGASFSSFASDVYKNGTWVPSEEGWQYADKEGEFVEDAWCYSNGVKFWINDEGYLGANEWVTDEEHTYYVQSDGSMAVNAWKKLYAEDEEDDSDAEEHWFYFDAKGRMVESKKYEIGDKYYYFDEDGKMLTGWIHKDDIVELDGAEDVHVSDVAYCGEDGALVRSGWVNAFPWTKEADNCYEGEDEEWYLTNSSGTPRYNTDKAVDGLKYFFNESGELMYEWIVKTAGGVYTSSDADIENGFEDGFSSDTVAEVYYADADYGYAKVNSWRELEDPTEDDDFWYYFDKLGRAFLATDADAANPEMSGYIMEFTNGEKYEVNPDSDKYILNTKKINDVYYYFNEKGEMLDGLVEINGKLMYLKDGARKTGKVTLTDENENDYTFFFADENDSSEGYEKYVAVTGNMDGYLYDNGQLVTSEDSDLYLEHTVTNGDETATFVVDYRGKIMHKDNKEYEGAGTYTFNTTNKGWNEDCVK